MTTTMTTMQRWQIQIADGPRWETWWVPGLGLCTFDSEAEATEAAQDLLFGVAATEGDDVAWRVIEMRMGQ